MLKKIILSGLLLCNIYAGESTQTTTNPNTATITQISTLQALLESCYEGVVSILDLKKTGDIGLGTFNNLDGEMIMLDGKVYKAKASGEVVEVADDETTPFANTAETGYTRISKTITPEDKITDLNALKNLLLKNIQNPNLPHAIKIELTTNKVKVRSVPEQKRPYPRLVEVVKHQAVFDDSNIGGTVIGFYFPKYFQGINISGFHLHFISADRKFGGHLLDISAKQGVASIYPQDKFVMQLPKKGDFATAKLQNREHAKEINKVEK